MGLHKAVSLCMDHCYVSGTVGDDSWYKTVILAGGSSCLPGLPGTFPMHNIGLIYSLDVTWYQNKNGVVIGNAIYSRSILFGSLMDIM